MLEVTTLEASIETVGGTVMVSTMVERVPEMAGWMMKYNWVVALTVETEAKMLGTDTVWLMVALLSS